MDVFDLKDLLKEHADSGERSLRFMFRDALSMSLYILPAGADDLQQPHTEDEVYYVLSGNATWVVGDETRLVSEGAVIYVDRHIPHKFIDITEELKLLVIFAPPYGSLAK
jgi:mannose-6-phosphate isomerase-like protein (cupin superfamily)|tara:strand:- start:700 stop:1029 length:330 start_codon:yes stop_codon:yes gene_type:complete